MPSGNLHIMQNIKLICFSPNLTTFGEKRKKRVRKGVPTISQLIQTWEIILFFTILIISHQITRTKRTKLTSFDLHEPRSKTKKNKTS